MHNDHSFTDYKNRIITKTMDAVNKAKSRFKNYPELLFLCRMEGLEYATCVIQHEKDLKLDSCKSQFIKYRNCLALSALKHNTRI